MVINSISQEFRLDYHKDRVKENNKKLKSVSPVLGMIFLIYLLQYIFFKDKSNQLYFINYLVIFSFLLFNAVLIRVYVTFSRKIESLLFQDIMIHAFYITSFILLIGLNVLDLQISTDYLSYAAGILSMAVLLRTSFKIFLTITATGFLLFALGLLVGFKNPFDISLFLPILVVTILSLYLQYNGEETRGHIFQLNMSLRETSIKDPLTHAYNRRFMLESLNGEIAKWERNSIPLSLIMIDIDFFKKINDDYNHSVGDQVLREISGVMASSIRTADLFCRYGGEEFTIILINADKKAAVIIAERIRQNIENFSFSEITDRKITVSLGVSEMEHLADRQGFPFELSSTIIVLIFFS